MSGLLGSGETPRMGRCRRCGIRLPAAARGPLPSVCRACNRMAELRYRITTARRLAAQLDRMDVAELPVRAELLVSR